MKTGAPPGCVLPSVSGSLVWADIFKYADDTAVVGTPKQHPWRYFFSLHFLEVKKTNEMVIDCSKNKISVPLSDINGDQIAMVSTHKYLGVETGDQLKQRLFFLRKLSLFRIDQQNALAAFGPLACSALLEICAPRVDADCKA